MFACIYGIPARQGFAGLLAGALPPGVSPDFILAEQDALFAGRAEQAHTGCCRLINVSGLPASGKSGRVRELLRRHPGFFHPAFDDIMTSLSLYREEWRKDSAAAYARWETPARIIGYAWLERCVLSKTPLIFEHGNSPEAHVALCSRLKNTYGYRVEIEYMDSLPELVKPRLKARDIPVSEQTVDARWSALQRLLPAYQALADSFTILPGWRENG